MRKELEGLMDNSTPIPGEDVKRLFKLMVDSHKESEITKRKIKKYDSIKEVMIQEITGKYEFYHYFFNKVFSERGEAIRKDFEIIDKGMKENNRDLLSAGISGLSQVVASSPIADIEKLRKMIEKVN